MKKRTLDFDGDFDNFLTRKRGFHNTVGQGVVAEAMKKRISDFQSQINPKVTGNVFGTGGISNIPSPSPSGTGIIGNGSSGGVGVSNPNALGGGVVRGGGLSVTSTGSPVNSGGSAMLGAGVIANAVKAELAKNPVVVTQPILAPFPVLGTPISNPIIGGGSYGGGGYSGGSSDASQEQEYQDDLGRTALIQKPEKRNYLPLVFGGVIIIGIYLMFSKK